MECSSMYFPLQVKEELLDESYEVPHPGMPGYYGPPSHFGPPPPPLLLNIKQEPGLNESQQHNHVDHRHVDSTMENGMPSPNITPLNTVLPGGGMRHPLNGTASYPSLIDGIQTGTTMQQAHMIDMSAPTKSKKKKKKIKQEPMQNEVLSPPPLPMTVSGKKRMKQEKITDTFKVRKKVDRFNGMPEEEVVKRTLPDHLTTDLDIVIIGINPGLFAAFKGHHYAGPGNHFWKCLYLSGLIPEPMTADDDFRLIEFGIGFTNIVSRTTRGSADLARKEIREGAQILQEKIQKYKPKIAVFNGKGIYEVFSGRKNFDFGKQPEPLEGTNTIIYVMPSSSARCAQLPRAVDKVPFYVALKKLRDHLCGRLPILRDSEVCFPDVKLKIENEDGIKTEPGDDDGAGGAEEAHARLMNCTVNSDGEYDSPRSALMHSQRNFHQHPLGRAALAAAAAAGGYLEVTLARAGFTASGSTTNRSSAAKHSAANMAASEQAKKKMSLKKKSKKKSGEDGNDSGIGSTGEGDLKRIKMESCGEHSGMSIDNVPCGSPNTQRHTMTSPMSGDYRSPTPNQMRPPTRPSPMSGFGTPGANYPPQLPASPPEHAAPMYGSPYLHPVHIKQEKMTDLLEGSRSPLGPGSPSSLLNGYPSSVGCLYNSPNVMSPGGYGPPPPQQAPPPPYFGSPNPNNPYGAYHHPGLGPPSLNPHHPLNSHHHHNPLAPPPQQQDMYGAASPNVLRENGLHHLMPQHEQQYYAQGVVSQVGGAGTAGRNAPSPYSPHKDQSSPVAFQQYPSPPAASYHQLHHMQVATPGGQYSSPDDGTSQNHPIPVSSPYDHQTASSPMYTNLDTVKVKQERMDPTYGEY